MKASSDAMLQLDHPLCFALHSASLAMTHLYNPLLEELGLTCPQYLAMLVLWEGDGLTVSQLDERLFLDSGTLTPLLKRLENQELLPRLRHAQDERRVLIRLTIRGRQLKGRASRIPGCILKAVQFEVSEVAALTSQIRRLRERLIASQVVHVKCTPPGASGTDTNPEQQFAAGYSACFIGAIKAVAGKMKSPCRPTWRSTPRWTWVRSSRSMGSLRA